MAKLTGINNTDFSSLISEIPSIAEATERAGAVLEENFNYLSTFTEGRGLWPEMYEESTPTNFVYADPEVGEIQIIGTGLPVLLDPVTGEFSAPTSSTKVTEITFTNADLNNLFATVKGSFSEKSVSVTEIAAGDDDFSFILTGKISGSNLDSSTPTVSGSLSAIRFNITDDQGTVDEGDDVRYVISFGLKAGTSSETITLNSLQITKDGLEILNLGSIGLKIATGMDLSTVSFFSGNDQIAGTVSADSLDTAEGNDKLEGLGGDDVLFAGAGNDKVDGGEGNDTIDGGEGNDKITDLSGNNEIYDLSGNNGITTGSGDDTVVAGAGNDKIVAGDGNNEVNAGDGNNKVTTGLGNDHVLAGSGNDGIKLDLGADTVDAGAGKNTIDLGKDTDADVVVFGDDFFAAVLDGSAETLAFDKVSNFNGGDSLNFFYDANEDEINDFSLLEIGDFYIASGAKPTDEAAQGAYVTLDTKSGKLYYDADGAGEGGAIQIGLVKGTGLADAAFYSDESGIRISSYDVAPS